MPCYLEAMKMGAVDYREKPVPPQVLLRFARTYVQNPPAGLRRIAARNGLSSIAVAVAAGCDLDARKLGRDL
jgi:FixJ family two-component response regulator